MKPLSDNPKIQLHEDFISPEEIATLIELGKKHETDSTVVDGKSGEISSSSYRICKVSHLRKEMDPIVQKLIDKLASFSRVRPEQVEGLQILRYTVGGHYFPHVDPFDTRNPALKSVLKMGGQRIVSALIGLKPADEGGETDFNRLKMNVNLMPGQCLLFWGLHPDGTPNMMAEHSAMPVIRGEKVILVSWMRERAFDGSEEVPDTPTEDELMLKLESAKRMREEECFKAIQASLINFNCTMTNLSVPRINSTTGEIYLEKEVRIISQ